MLVLPVELLSPGSLFDFQMYFLKLSQQPAGGGVAGHVTSGHVARVCVLTGHVMMHKCENPR